MARGHIRRRRTKTKGFVYDIKYRTGDGTQVKKAIGPNRKEAERALNSALAAVDRGEQETTSRECFAQVADRWLERKRPLIEEGTYHSLLARSGAFSAANTSRSRSWVSGRAGLTPCCS